MKQFRSKIMLIGVIAMTMLSDTPVYSFPAAKEQMQEAAQILEDKYHEKFEILSLKQPDLGTNYYSVFAYSVDYPDLVFRADISRDAAISTDEYVCDRVCAQMSEKMEENLQALQDDYSIFTEAMLPGTAITDPNASLKAFLEDGPNKFYIYVCIAKQEESDGTISKELSHILDGLEQIDGTLQLYYVDQELLSDIQGYVTSHDKVYTEFDEMTRDASICTIPFKNSSITIPSILLTGGTDV